MGRELVSKPSDPEVSRRRVEAVFGKAERGEELTEKEMLIVQWETALSRGCHACGRRVVISHRPRRKGEER